MFNLTQMIKSPTCITYRSTLLIDHILASLPDRISQEGVMNVGLSDHQLIYCTSRVELKLEVCTKKSNSVQLRIICEVDAFKNALKKINFPNYKYF